MISGGLLLLWNQNRSAPSPEPEDDIVSEAFDKYEQLWRDAAIKTAKALEEEVLWEAEESRDFNATANIEARKKALLPLAEKEEESYLNWDPKAHAKLLREYE